jgi:hypothetical protein
VRAPSQCPILFHQQTVTPSLSSLCSSPSNSMMNLPRIPTAIYKTFD